MEQQRRNRNSNTGEIFYGSGFLDTLTKIGKTITGKTASKLASKAAEKLVEKGAEKVGEKTGEVLGEKIYEKFSTKRSPKGKEIVKILQEEWKKPPEKPATRSGIERPPITKEEIEYIRNGIDGLLI